MTTLQSLRCIFKCTNHEIIIGNCALYITLLLLISINIYIKTRLPLKRLVLYTLYFKENKGRATLKTDTQTDNVVSLTYWTFIDLKIFDMSSDDNYYFYRKLIIYIITHIINFQIQISQII